MKSRVLTCRAVLACAVVLLGGCVNRTPQLYMWDTFPRQQYDTLLRTGSNVDDQIRTLEGQAEKARGTNAALPPGFRAHLGMLYLSTGNAGKARELWLSEKAVFPESAPFMDRLLDRLNAPAVVKKEENPT